MPARTKEIPFMPSTLETIDYAIYNWLNDELDLHTTTQDGFKKVPVIWSAAERAFQVKRGKDIRDQDGTLVLPLITIERTSVAKNPARKGTAWANIPPFGDEKGGSITVARRIKQDKTANFANADSWRKESGTGPNQRTFIKRDSRGRALPTKKVVYETITMPMPVYLDITYSISIKTEYQQQMNDLATPFMTRTGGINYFTTKHAGHRFESFIQSDFSQDNNVSLMEGEHRSYETKIDINTLGYIIGEGKNQEQPKFVIRENAVEVKLPREKVIMGDIPEHVDKRGFYKE
tara:strand:- start:911 stop:1783 length:873 start_codon:yes stop_codon:yes gene_type:complete